MAKDDKTKEKIEKESKHQQEIQLNQESDVVEEEEDEARSFEELGLDPRLIRALNKKETSIAEPTPIQRVAIPLIFGKMWLPGRKQAQGRH
uniref:DEAD-box RNA helicase Q domain-containing protein n=1 Tax=Salix viminalis TaxID=40686 RepID=A0A6N2L9P3_SALVM